MIVFLRCSTNNRASTVFDAFQSAVDKFGPPSRVRSDKGKENTDVAWFMLSHPLRGPDRGSHITGRSVHNQRIERLWRDMFCGCIYVFYNLFYYMEECRLLDVTNELHLDALHYVFLPRINRNLSLFAEGHNRGPISTEHNRSPEQLWISGMLSNPTGRVTEEFNGQVLCYEQSYNVSTVYKTELWIKVKKAVFPLFILLFFSSYSVCVACLRA